MRALKWQAYEENLNIESVKRIKTVKLNMRCSIASFVTFSKFAVFAKYVVVVCNFEGLIK